MTHLLQLLRRTRPWAGITPWWCAFLQHCIHLPNDKKLAVLLTHDPLAPASFPAPGQHHLLQQQ